MDPSQRGWPLQPNGNPHSHQGSAERNHEQSHNSSRSMFGANPQTSPQGAPGPPLSSGGPFPHFHQPSQSLASLAGISQSSPRQPPPSLGHQEGPPSGPSQPHQLPLPGFSQATGQPGAIDRGRAREAEQIHIKEEEDRRHREQQDRQRLEQLPPHQSQPGSTMPLHQPVAVAPRSIHGPNGLLGNPGPQPQPQMPLGAPSGPVNIFAGGPVQPVGSPQGPNQQTLQPGLLMPLAPGPQSQPAQQQQQQQQQAAGQQGQGQGQQPILNDALSYLDQVKVQFNEHPDVYNRFLDIMKDFKSGAIDTPGVIGRVSQLFAGNPDLIQGFNTFLPPGYRIECGADNDPNTIRVTTPMGTTVSSMPQPRPISRQGEAHDNSRPVNGTFTPQPGQAQMVFSPSGRPIGPSTLGQQQPQHLSPTQTARQKEQQAIHQQEQVGVNSLQSAVSAAASGSGMPAGVSQRTTPLPSQQVPHAASDDPSGQPGMEKRGPVEFNHAISYVNKIKNRFASQPDIYKQFLEILQTYQRESKPIQDVYSQVTTLFRSAPDLLEDFKQFLPESAAQAKAAERARQQAEENVMMSNARNETMYGSPVVSRETHIGTPNHGRGNLPPVGNFAPTPIGKDNKRKRTDQIAASSVVEGQTAAVGAKGAAPGTQQGKRVKQSHVTTGKALNDPPPTSPSLVPRLPEPLPPTTTSAATMEEIGFFDRAKKAIGNKNVMNEFLKLCNLFSQDLIDRTFLVYRAKTFLGNSPELMKWFTDFVGYDEKDIVIENKVREPMVPGGRISLSNCRGLGPSYRLLPKRERLKMCSGRDELCNSVLNDEWASHPTWASEDSGFIAHRKNVHEEGLHRIEEERHDYDYNIEACARTVQLLEPIAQQLRRLSPAEQVAFTLQPGLGGQSETIYKRVIMKLYGREKGADVIKQLHESPYQVIPVLLNRMNERLESWKMAQREWEKVWREQTQKMFWKSLDHQAANVRTSDRRQFQTKTLQAEMQVKYEEFKAAEKAHRGYMRDRPLMQQHVADIDVIADTAWMLLLHVETPQNTENPRLGPFVREFVPLFFGIDGEIFDRKLKDRLGGGSTNGVPFDESMSGAEDSGSERRGRKTFKNTLYRQTLDPKGGKGKFGRKARDDSNAPMSRASTPDVTSNAGEDVDVAEGSTPVGEGDASQAVKQTDSSDRWLDHPVTGNMLNTKRVFPNEVQKRNTYRMWATTPIFCFVRMFEMVYQRLHALKTSEQDCKELVRNAKKTKPAKELGIIDKLPEDFFADTSSTANYYQQMLSKFAQVLEGELDFSADGVEDCLRRFYMQSGYPLYALEKMIQTLARYGGQIAHQEGGNKERSWDVFSLWKRDRLRGDESSAVQATDFRKAAEKLIGAGDEYAIDWNQDAKMLNFFLVKKDDPYFNEEALTLLDQEEQWRYYIASYTTIGPTEGFDHKNLSRVLLPRNISAAGGDPKSEDFASRLVQRTSPEDDNVDGDNADSAAGNERLLSRILAAKNDEQLILRIAVNNYHPVFQPGTAEGFHESARERTGGEEGVRAAEVCREERREAMMEAFVVNSEAMKDLSSEEVAKKDEEFARMLEGTVGGEKGDQAEGEEMQMD